MLNRLIVVLFAPVFIALSIPGNAVAVAPVTLLGKLTNGTEGAGLPGEGIVVTAAQLTTGGDELTRQSTKAGPDGSFSFGGFDAEPARHFVIATTYQGVTYSTVVDYAGKAEIPVELKVFEITGDDSVVRATSDSLTVIKGKEDILEVLQTYRVENISDRTYVGRADDDSSAVIRLPVAAGGFDIAAAEGMTAERVTTSAEGIAAGDPLQPGEAVMSFSYRIRIPRTGWDMARAIAYPTDHVDILVGPSLELRNAPGFEFAETKRFGDSTFTRFRAGPFTAGEFIEGNISEDAASSPALWAGLGATAAVLIAAITAGSMIRRKRSRDEPPPSIDERQRLIEKIAELDERFAAGKLGQQDYENMRQQMKRELVSVTEQLVD